MKNKLEIIAKSAVVAGIASVLSLVGYKCHKGFVENETYGFRHLSPTRIVYVDNRQAEAISVPGGTNVDSVAVTRYWGEFFTDGGQETKVYTQKDKEFPLFVRDIAGQAKPL